MRIKELDGLRGIAVLAVISEHYLSWLPAAGSAYGWLGVDLFFILSGFLITSILLELRGKERYFSVFYARRAFRIFPPYFLGIAIYMVTSFAVGQPGTWGLWSQYIFYYTSLFVGQPPQLHAIPAILPPLVVLGLAVLWSLSVEEIYYTLWAPIVRFTNQASFSVILAGMILVAPVLRWIFHTPEYPEIYTFYCRMDGLAFGSAVALLLRDRKLAPAIWLPRDKWFDRAALLVIPVTAAFWLLTQGDRSHRIVTTLGLTLVDLSFALFAHALIRRAGSSAWWVSLFRARWLRSIGMVSYSLYLFHYPLRSVAVYLVEMAHFPRHIEAIAGVLLGLVLSFAAAYGLWYGMESHILRWKDRAVKSPAHAG